MTAIFVILIVITCAALAFFVLIQNPKGGGLAGSFSGLGTQMMGAKQSTDVVEKGTWYAATAVLVLTLLSFIMAPKSESGANEKTRAEKANVGMQAPAMPQPQAPAPAQGAQPAPQGQENAAAPAQAPAPAAAPTPAPADAAPSTAQPK
ncbi:MAG: preprotein translocase subunit SecG [Chitinophagaceae bacterium]|nr:preprotein translocase subunit SecG [Chitinophagaceae bacterium]